ncbi:hypothetical protein [Streptomyces sp. Ag109_G2-15]|uniref:hypothetical protein n=1 Tax=Streptomyces sp. Ag109_G2-15 TaxID=1938850 RepID=UPI000BD541EB|nr:hypothetical protein [Streptomyces sp. Ag109_G2-15]SOD86720.1 hypothetical protein SAMN06272765_4190 [Streptomyces sp. Ag109_G2-15]
MRDGRTGLVLVCACYLLVVHITNRGLIAAPRYRLLQARLRDCRARAGVLAAGCPEGSAEGATVSAVLTRLQDLDLAGTVVWRLSPRFGVLAIPLSKLAAAWRVLHSAERRLLSVESAAEFHAQRQWFLLRLAASSDPADGELAARLATDSAADPQAPEARALLLTAAQRVHDLEDTASERDYEQQRIALWLAMTGLGSILLIGSVLDHRATMLLGALGGFLSPVIGVLRSQRPSSWGVLVLAPVGGALAAVGGLLLVRMLADPDLNLLGQVFLENSWAAPARPLALAMALLFGFSGTLFSRLALTATGQLTGPSPRPV